MYFNTCDFCGAHLDPNEKCDCRENREKQRREMMSVINENKQTKQLYFIGGECHEKTACF